MGQISSAVQDEELIEHMRDVLLPFIKEVQVAEEIERHVSPGLGTPEQLIKKNLFYSGSCSSRTDTTTGL